MLGFTIILLSVSSVFGGVSIRMPYLNPAGVTYTSYEGASPFLNPHFGVRSFAYGNAYSVHQAPVAVAPVVAHAAPLVPAVKHVPAVAHVPVTKYEAHPAVIQDVVDVHKAKIATKKFEIRRPAIEKEFFDVEERIVVRPAGKAVVELDQPVSKNQRGPTVVSPAPELAHVVQPVAVARTVPVAHTVHAVHAVHTPVIAATAQPIHVPALAPVHVEAPAHVVSSTPAPFDFPQQPFPQPAQPDFPQQDFPQQPSFPQQPQDFPQQPSFPQQPQDFPQQPQQPQQFDDSDSVSVENPEIARARVQQLPQPDRDQFRNQQLFRAQQANDLFRSQQIEGQRIQQLQGLQEQIRPQPELFRAQQINADLFRSQQIIEGQRVQNEQIARQQQVERQQFDRQQQNAREQFERQQQAQERRFQIEQIERLFQQPQPVDRRIQPSTLDRQMQNDLQARLLQQQPQRFDQPGPPQRLEEVPQLPNLDLLRIRTFPRPEERIQANSRSGEISRQNGPAIETISRAPEIPSFRLSQEQSISNQQRLIDLLTARGGITEVRGPGENSLGGSQVRTRVLSVTPAPLEARSQDEKVNTRRIVVNRPITTVEEVDVVEPFTKIERVAVHQPALIKTAKVGVASVPTSVPVQTYAHALHF